MKTSLKIRILNYCQSRNCWVSSAELEDRARENAYKGETAGRRARELEMEGYLDRKIIRGIVWYHYRETGILQELHMFDKPKVKQLRII